MCLINIFKFMYVYYIIIKNQLRYLDPGRGPLTSGGWSESPKISKEELTTPIFLSSTRLKLKRRRRRKWQLKKPKRRTAVRKVR